jgi:hypothetical protein
MNGVGLSTFGLVWQFNDIYYNVDDGAGLSTSWTTQIFGVTTTPWTDNIFGVTTTAWTAASGGIWGEM